MRIKAGRLLARLAQSDEDVRAAQRLRYSVFVEEMGAAAAPEQRAVRLEWDRFDPFCDHLILIDEEARPDDPLDQVVGVYRLLRGSTARSGPGFYTSSEYDLTPLVDYPREILEMGRSCVAAPYRSGSAMQLLWMGLSHYIDAHDIGLLMGCASFHGSDVSAIAPQLSWLHHKHIAPPGLRPRALPDHYVNMNLTPLHEIDPASVVKSMPPLIKGYLRAGGHVGDGAYIDHDFNTIDVFFVVETSRISERHRSFYSRPSAESLEQATE